MADLLLAQIAAGVAGGIIITVFLLFILFVVLIGVATRYKKCPSDQVLVIYGKTRGDKAARCIHGGAAFVIPVIQDYAFLSLQPMQIDVGLTNALCNQNIRINVPSVFTVGISTDEALMGNAANRLLGLTQDEIANLAKDIIFGQLRLVIASMTIEQINSDRETFLRSIEQNVAEELNKIGLLLLNVNITDITVCPNDTCAHLRPFHTLEGLLLGQASQKPGVSGDRRRKNKGTFVTVKKLLHTRTREFSEQSTSGIFFP